MRKSPKIEQKILERRGQVAGAWMTRMTLSQIEVAFL
jgi:hypothetical protein